MEAPTRALKLFYCYAHADKIFRDELDKHLTSLKRQQVLTTWYDGEIKAGTEWEQEIGRHLSSADLIVLFISSDFLHSDYCYNIEMKRAMERHEAGTAHIIPILVRPVYWEGTPLSKLQLLPTEARPISRWPNHDDVWVEIVQQINTIAIQTALKEHLREGAVFYLQKHYEDALAAYEYVIQLVPDDVTAHFSQGNMLDRLGHYEDALAAYVRVIELAPNDVGAHISKGKMLYKLKRYEEAWAICEYVIQLAPNNVGAHMCKGKMLYELGHYEEALAAYEYVIQLAPNNVDAHMCKGKMLYELMRYKDALAAYVRVIELDPDNMDAYMCKGNVLDKLGHRKDARAAYEHANHRRRLRERLDYLLPDN